MEEERKENGAMKVASGTLGLRRSSDAEVYGRAHERGQATFTLVAQDRSAPRLICEWIKENIETCPPAKLYEALARALQMREYGGRKSAD